MCRLLLIEGELPMPVLNGGGMATYPDVLALEIFTGRGMVAEPQVTEPGKDQND